MKKYLYSLLIGCLLLSGCVTEVGIAPVYVNPYGPYPVYYGPYFHGYYHNYYRHWR